MADVLVQTRLPPAVYEWVAAQARASGLSIAGWLRHHLHTEVSRMFIEAWGVQMKNKPRYPPNDTAEFLLVPSRDISAKERLFWVYHGPGSERPGLPVSAGWFQGYGVDPDDLGMFLKGGTGAWKLVSTMFDATSQRVEATLQAR